MADRWGLVLADHLRSLGGGGFVADHCLRGLRSGSTSPCERFEPSGRASRLRVYALEAGAQAEAEPGPEPARRAAVAGIHPGVRWRGAMLGCLCVTRRSSCRARARCERQGVSEAMRASDRPGAASAARTWPRARRFSARLSMAACRRLSSRSSTAPCSSTTRTGRAMGLASTSCALSASCAQARQDDAGRVTCRQRASIARGAARAHGHTRARRAPLHRRP